MMACDELRMANPSRWKKLKLRNLKSEDFPMARVVVLGNNGNTACHLEELDIVGFMIDSGLKLSHEQHEPDWQNCSFEHFALISAS